MKSSAIFLRLKDILGVPNDFLYLFSRVWFDAKTFISGGAQLTVLQLRRIIELQLELQFLTLSGKDGGGGRVGEGRTSYTRTHTSSFLLY